MIRRELKEKAFELRKSGESYNSISTKLGIANGMLSYWFSRYEWSRKISETNSKNLAVYSRQRIIELNRKRAIKLKERYNLVENEAIKEFELYKNESIFIAALMLYLGEGDKSLANQMVRIGNIDVSVLKIFIKFLLKYCKIPIEKVRFWVLCYPDLDVKICETWWSKELGLKANNFYKSQVIQGKHKTKRLLYGVGTIIIGGKSLKIKLLKWIELACKDLG